MVSLFPYLKAVNLSRCKYLGDQCLITLVEKLQHLEVLGVLDADTTLVDPDRAIPSIDPIHLTSLFFGD